jgi:hypothetical protein
MREQNGNVIADGIDFDEGRIMVLEDPMNVGVELAALLIAEAWAPALCTEDEVHNAVGE